MSSVEIRKKLHEIIDEVPENALPNVLGYLQDIEALIEEENITSFIKELQTKHDSLLARLAK